jgi:uncharacterized membrane protein YoaK (UPF0700 family)
MSTFLADARQTVAPSRDGLLLPPLVAALTVVTGLVDSFSLGRSPPGLRYALIVVLSLTMGVQNATARKLAVPDLTTTVLTLTITGIAADSLIAGGTGSHAARRLISVAAMLVGAALVLHINMVYPLVIALVILAAATLAAIKRTSHPSLAV